MSRPDIVPEIEELRANLYEPAMLKASGEAAAGPDDVQGVVVEIGMDGSVIVIAGFADGTSRLFLGRGGGVLGEKEDFPMEALEAARSLVESGAPCVLLAEKEKKRVWPSDGAARFCLLTRRCVRSFEMPVVGLEEDEGPAGTLWASANTLLEHLLPFMEKGERGD